MTEASRWALLLLVGLLALPRVAGAGVLGAGFGLQVDGVREDLLVPLTFAGPGPRLRLAYRGWAGPGVLSAQLDAGYGFLFNRFGHAAESITYGATVAWLVPRPNSTRWHWAFGLAAASDARINYLHRWDDSHRYWLGAQWLGPSARVARELGGWRWEANLTLALLGLESRPAEERFIKQEPMNQVGYYFTTPVSDERLFTPAQTQIVRLGLAAKPNVSAQTEFAPGWTYGVEAYFSRASRPRTNINLGVLLCATRYWGL